MRKHLPSILQFIAFVMLFIGIISFFFCIAKGDEVGRGYFTKDPVAQTMWYIGIIPSLSTFFSSFIVFGFSYIVEAACKYLEKCETEDRQRLTNNTEE